MEQILQKLKTTKNRDNTRQTYFRIWRSFNDFVIRLDEKPKSWEERTSLFLAFLIDNGAQSATIKSYKSAIKCILCEDDYDWDENKILITALTKACRLKNDVVHTRLPIKMKLMELILFEVQRIYDKQPFLDILYKTVFALSYYGMLRIGEVTQSEHVIKAKNIHVAQNKKKILMILYSSKTHGKESRPQKIKISAKSEDKYGEKARNFCPFNLARTYLKIRGGYKSDNEQLFVFHNNEPLKSYHVREVLSDCLSNLGLNDRFYSYHSMRGGRATNLAEWGGKFISYKISWTLEK